MFVFVKCFAKFVSFEKKTSWNVRMNIQIAVCSLIDISTEYRGSWMSFRLRAKEVLVCVSAIGVYTQLRSVSSEVFLGHAVCKV